ncbi:ROK family transcriptional regulator [Pyrinomonas methylaliphatogenes]|uniref:Transcriptional regulator/sugar kinase n=1 Tax=Pyrinomonas methylaliphatogenes TaxID=454194 RepID=A0A0B6WWR8_9BACT|nr:ROK family transcriptional regulator [Pyrinomonas methylaliphatogenes]CDM64734.1 transcriptional regulator/sugar kinase [Pyrinomonas methylaliphatogenes]
MRKINPYDFRVAKRSTSREINRQIVLNLVREHQPISRADLARRMKVGRNVISMIVNELIADGLIYEGATGETVRGRKPTFLHVRTQDRFVIAVDIRFSRTYLMLTDFGGRQIALETFETVLLPDDLIAELVERMRRILATHNAAANCEGIGIAIPGIVDHRTGVVLNAPALEWRNVDLRTPLAKAMGLPIHIENAPKACALAEMWLGANGTAPNDFIFVTVSDGVGVGIVINGELIRGHDNVAGEFGHAPLSLDGPRCLCGSVGCWEAYISNLATLARYFGYDLSRLRPKRLPRGEESDFTITDLIARARAGDERARSAIQGTARYLGIGLANLLNGLNPECVYIGGEIMTAWDMIEPVVRKALAERALTERLAQTPIRISTFSEYPRLRGAAALVTAPIFAAPRVA